MYDITKTNLCINCEQYMNIDGHHICKHFLTEDKYSLVTGELFVTRCTQCEAARNEQAKCGKRGQHYTEKTAQKEVQKPAEDPVDEISVVSKAKKDKKDISETQV